MITAETKALLIKETTANLQAFTSMADKVHSSIKMAEAGIELLSKSNTNASATKTNETKDLEELSQIGKYTLLLALIWLDITTAFRLYLKAEENYEVMYSAKQLVIITNEAFKKLYRFENEKDGQRVLKNKKGALWIKQIGGVIKKFPHLIPHYDVLTKELDEFNDETLALYKEIRELAVHYDVEPLKVYDMLIQIDIENVALKIIPLMAIISNMIIFNNNIIVECNNLIKDRNDNFFSFHLNKLESLKNLHPGNSKMDDLLSEFQQYLQDFRDKN